MVKGKLTTFARSCKK